MILATAVATKQGEKDVIILFGTEGQVLIYDVNSQTWCRGVTGPDRLEIRDREPSSAALFATGLVIGSIVS